MSQLTIILGQMEKGDDQDAARRLLVVVYDELRKLAHWRMAQESVPQTLQPTALVHEAWLRLGADLQPTWQNRAHFFGAAAEAMRRILIEKARSRQALRHGAGQARVVVEESEIRANVPEMGDERLIALDEALEKLAKLDSRKAQLVKLRYFAGMSIEEAAK